MPATCFDVQASDATIRGLVINGCATSVTASVSAEQPACRRGQLHRDDPTGTQRQRRRRHRRHDELADVAHRRLDAGRAQPDRGATVERHPIVQRRRHVDPGQPHRDRTSRARRPAGAADLRHRRILGAAVDASAGPTPAPATSSPGGDHGIIVHGSRRHTDRRATSSAPTSTGTVASRTALGISVAEASGRSRSAAAAAGRRQRHRRRRLRLRHSSIGRAGRHVSRATSSAPTSTGTLRSRQPPASASALRHGPTSRIGGIGAGRGQRHRLQRRGLRHHRRHPAAGSRSDPRQLRSIANGGTSDDRPGIDLSASTRRRRPTTRATATPAPTDVQNFPIDHVRAGSGEGAERASIGILNSARLDAPSTSTSTPTRPARRRPQDFLEGRGPTSARPGHDRRRRATRAFDVTLAGRRSRPASP